ncbi:MAG: hypothetical protein AB2794_11620 [Candidatus Thiodiazotropha endolucinida]
MEILRSRLLNIFRLSPPEKRLEVTGIIGRWFTNGFHVNHYNDDYRYIAVLVFRNTIIVSAVAGLPIILIVLYLTQILNVDVSTLEYLEYDYLATRVGFVSLYAYVHARVMGYAILAFAPVYFFLFLIYVKKGEVDLFRYDNVLKYKENRIPKEKFKRFLLFLFTLVLGAGMASYSYMTLSFVSRWIPDAGLGESYIFLLLYYGFSIGCHAYGALILYFSMIFIYGLAAGYDRCGGL